MPVAGSTSSDQAPVLPGASQDEIDGMIEELELGRKSASPMPPVERPMTPPRSPPQQAFIAVPAPGQGLKREPTKLEGELSRMAVKFNDQVDSWATVFGNLMTTTTLHGIKYVADDHRIRKMCWMSLVVVAFILFMGQSIARVVEYYHYKTTINVQVLNNASMAFPAITICNQNFLRMTSTHELSLYHPINTFFDNSRSTADQQLTFPSPPGMNMSEFLIHASHQRKHLIDQCTWNGDPCTDEDFATSITDMGVCYTFNAINVTEPKLMENPGAQNGLRLLMNIEMYEHMNGPISARGVKVLLHEREEPPLVKDLGMSLPAGSHALLGIKMEKMNAMEPPWGTCQSKPLTYADTYSYSACIVECVAAVVNARCGCVAPYMVPNSPDGPRSCSIQDNFDCVEPLLADYHEVVKDCDCPLACNRNLYSPSASYSSLANVMGLVQRGGNLPRIRSSLLAARETSQRVDAAVRAADQRVLNDVLDKMLATPLGDVENLYEYDAAGQVVNPFSEVLDQFISAIDYTGHDDWQRMRALLRAKRNMYSATYGRQVSSVSSYSTSTLETVIELINGDMLTTREVLALGLTDVLEPSLVKDMDETIEQLVTAVNKIKKLETVFNADPSLLYSPEEIALLPRSMMLEANPLTPEMFGYLFSNIIGVTWVDVNTTRYLLDMATAFEELRDEMMAVRDNTSLQWGSDGAGFDFEMYNEALASIKNISDRIAVDILPLYGKHVGWFSLHHSYMDFQIDVWYLDALNSFYNFKGTYSRENSLIRQLRATISNERNELQAKVDSYNAGTLTKLALAEHISFERVDAFKSSLDALVSSLSTLEYERIAYSDWISFSMRLGFQATTAWYVMMDTDLLTDELYTNMSQPLFASSGEIGGNSTCQETLHKVLPRANIMNETLQTRYETTRKVVDCLMSAWQPVSNKALLSVGGQGLGSIIASEVRGIKNAYDAAQARLAEYVDSTEIDDKFYLDNFLQLDVFYDEFRYEEVTQQEAFALLSLYGELGGFMGLLLGGSLLTVFELIDALLVNCIKKVKGKKTVHAGECQA